MEIPKTEEQWRAALTAELPSLVLCLGVSTAFALVSLGMATATARRSGVL